MAVTFEQFMVNIRNEMFIKSRLVIFIFLLLPLVILSSNVRKRRRPGIDENTQDSKESYPDQVALATNYHQQDYIPREEYSENSGNLQHHTPPKGSDKTNVDSSQSKFFEDNLANTKSAHEYVEKALQLHISHEGSNSDHNIVEKPQPNPKINVIPSSASARYEVYEKPETQTENPTQYYSKEAVTRSSYDLFDFDDDDDFHKPHQQYSTYSTVRYEPLNYDGNRYNRHQDMRHDDHIPAPSSELPKEEILKHIEESVIKYMKTLEAERKIPTSEPKVYYKIQHPSSEPMKSHNIVKQKGIVSESETGIKFPHPTPTTAIKILLKEEPSYQTPQTAKEAMENLPENVEFIYKIKTRSPPNKYKNSQVPHKIPNKIDHNAALKHLQGLGISQVIQEERPTKAKLYFNAETYRDINSLPFKPEKILMRQEYKERDQRRPLMEYKTFVAQEDPGPNQYVPVSGQQNQNVDDGYPIMNPYRFVLNKEPFSQNEPNNGLNLQTPSWQPYNPNKDVSNLQYDSYSPKYNNNPDGYGYQHNYKPPDVHGSYSLKTLNRTPNRGKRGHSHSKKSGRKFSINKDSEASTALRPPPRNNQS